MTIINIFNAQNASVVSDTGISAPEQTINNDNNMSYCSSFVATVSSNRLVYAYVCME